MKLVCKEILSFKFEFHFLFLPIPPYFDTYSSIATYKLSSRS